jgi:hypothetical protein
MNSPSIQFITRIFAALTISGFIQNAHSSITSVSGAGSASAAHTDVFSGGTPIFMQSYSGAMPFALTSPLTQSDPGPGFLVYSTQASITVGVTVSTPSFLQYDSYFAGYVEMYGERPDTFGGNARVGMNASVNFTLDSPGTVNISSYNSLLSNVVGSPVSSKLIWFDGVLIQTSFADGNYVIPVSAGPHSFQEIPDLIAGFSGTYNSKALQGTSRTRLTVEAIPEPTSLLTVVIGLAGFAWRRGRN